MPEVKKSAIAAFADELRSWRQRLGWSQVELAEKIAYSPSLVSGVETMAKTPTLDFAERCDEATGTPGTFVRLHDLVTREAYPSYFAPVLGFEREATSVHSWEPGVVPGLLQTAGYARSVIRSSHPRDSDEAIDRMLAARLERQEIVARDQPPMLWFIVAEGALRQFIGGRTVMDEQLGKLAAMAAHPGLVIQVLPFAATEHAGTDGPISVYDFDGAPSVGYTECYGGGRVVEAHDEVGALMTAISMLRASALSPQDSAELVRKIRSEIGGN